MTDSLLKEVDNALRWHRLQALWERSGRQIVLFVCLAFIALVALLLYKQMQRSQWQEQSGQLLAALAAQQAPVDTTQLTGNFSQMGHLLNAGLLWQNGKIDEATASLNTGSLAQDGSTLLADYTCLQQQLAGGNMANDCANDSAFADLLLESRILHVLSAQGAGAAAALLPEAGKDNARLSMLRAYLRSHSAPIVAGSEPNNASEIAQ